MNKDIKEPIDKDIPVPENLEKKGPEFDFPNFKSFSKVDRDLLIILSFIFVVIILFLGLASFLI